jgi:hypothetical protein
MRPIQILDTPIADPYVCIKCGLGAGSDRRHWVDLGVDSSMKQKDEHGQVHLFEGVIYLCNMCTMSLIGDYLGKLFGFINNQEMAYSMTQAQRQEQLETLHNEIFTLRDQLNRRDDELKEAKLQLNEYQSNTAEQVIGQILSGRNSEDDAGSDSDSEGTNQSSDGNDSAVESPDFTADSLFQLHLAVAAREHSS